MTSYTVGSKLYREKKALEVALPQKGQKGASKVSIGREEGLKRVR